MAIGPRNRAQQAQEPQQAPAAEASPTTLTDEQGMVLTAPDGTQVTEG